MLENQIFHLGAATRLRKKIRKHRSTIVPAPLGIEPNTNSTPPTTTKRDYIRKKRGPVPTVAPNLFLVLSTLIADESPGRVGVSAMCDILHCPSQSHLICIQILENGLPKNAETSSAGITILPHSRINPSINERERLRLLGAFSKDINEIICPVLRCLHVFA